MNNITKFFIETNQFINELLNSDQNHSALILSIQVSQISEWVGKIDDEIMESVCAEAMESNANFMEGDVAKWDRVWRGQHIDSMVIKLIKSKEV